MKSKNKELGKKLAELCGNDDQQCANEIAKVAKGKMIKFQNHLAICLGVKEESWFFNETPVKSWLVELLFLKDNEKCDWLMDQFLSNFREDQTCVAEIY